MIMPLSLEGRFSTSREGGGSECDRSVAPQVRIPSHGRRMEGETARLETRSKQQEVSVK